MRLKHESSICEVLVGSQWHECEMAQLDMGDVFRIRKPNGALHEDSAGMTAWRCLEIPAVQCEPIG